MVKSNVGLSILRELGYKACALELRIPGRRGLVGTSYILCHLRIALSYGSWWEPSTLSQDG